MNPAQLSRLLVPAALVLLASPLAAQRGGWGGAGWGGWGGAPGWGGSGRATAAADSREGKVQVSRFVADGAAVAALGHGTIAVGDAPGAGPHAEAREDATYQAAIVDQLARAGYDTATLAPTGGQIAEMRVSHSQLAPGDPAHKPVSGEMTMGVSNRGSMLGMAIAIDGTKPRGALISTELELRIRDRASGTALWEGRAEIATREGDPHWNDQKIAAKLAGVLLDHFPARSGDSLAER